MVQETVPLSTITIGAFQHHPIATSAPTRNPSAPSPYSTTDEVQQFLTDFFLVNGWPATFGPGTAREETAACPADGEALYRMSGDDFISYFPDLGNIIYDIVQDGAWGYVSGMVVLRTRFRERDINASMKYRKVLLDSLSDWRRSLLSGWFAPGPASGDSSMRRKIDRTSSPTCLSDFSYASSSRTDCASSHGSSNARSSRKDSEFAVEVQHRATSGCLPEVHGSQSREGIRGRRYHRADTG